MKGKPKIIFDLRADARTVLEQLREPFDMVPLESRDSLAPNPPMYAPHEVRIGDQAFRVPFGNVVDVHYKAVCGAIAYVDAIQPDAMLLWNTCLPVHAALALAGRKAGIPVLELNHWRVSTRLVAHFEDQPLASHIVCAQEYDDFATERGTTCERLVFGQPSYDDWVPPKRTQRMERRVQLGLPEDARIIVMGKTWTHHLSMWSDAEYAYAAEGAIVGALGSLQADNKDIICVWSFRGNNTPEALRKVSHHCVRAGMAEDRLFLTDDTDVKDLATIADLVVTPKSGFAVDALMMETPSVMVDFRPNFDGWATEERGLSHATDPDEIQGAIMGILHDDDIRGLTLEQQRENRAYFGGTGDATARLIAWLKENTCASS